MLGQKSTPPARKPGLLISASNGPRRVMVSDAAELGRKPHSHDVNALLQSIFLMTDAVELGFESLDSERIATEHVFQDRCYRARC